VPSGSYRVKDAVGRGIDIGSAGLPSYHILLEGHTDALENDIVILYGAAAGLVCCWFAERLGQRFGW
jgi:hypothetical protein